jgi:dipeptidyl-peptidase-4
MALWGVMLNRKMITALLAVILASQQVTAHAQDRLPTYPGADQYATWLPKIDQGIAPGTVAVRWDASGQGFAYEGGADRGQAGAKHFDLATKASVAIGAAEGGFRRPTAGDGRAPDDLTARGAYARDYAMPQPAGGWTAITRGGNIYLVRADGSAEKAVTTDGSAAGRIRNGVPTYVYTEELAMGQAMWWSRDGKKLAYMRFDEARVPDYPLQLDQTKLYSTTRIIAYPSPGSPNPIPDLFVYDVASGVTTRIDTRDGRPFTDEVMGHYLWQVGWSLDDSEIRLERANRRQNSMEWVGCSPQTGACRVIDRESQSDGWTTPGEKRFLADHQRFILKSARNGWENFYLCDVSGQLLNPITRHSGFEVGNILRVDEPAGLVWYMARDGDDYMKWQLHRVSLDGSGDVRLTDPHFNHAVSLSPDGKAFVDTIQTHDIPPSTRVVRILADDRVDVLGEIARSDLTAYDQAKLRRVEMFTFTAADGATPLQAMLSFPHNFDPKKKYPVLVSIYGGPETNQASESFQMPDPLTEYGFLVLKADLRNASGRGKAMLSAIYGQVGQAEVDDQAAAVKALWTRPYVDKQRVGIFGTSYGGSMAAWSILRYPDVYAAAAASSPVTDHRLYDSIYSERYMGLPADNPHGYARTSAMTYAANLKGALLIYYGTADDNVHPKNALSLIQALQAAGKHFEVQVGPDRGHTSVNPARMMEFFIENLVLHSQAPRN